MQDIFPKIALFMMMAALAAADVSHLSRQYLPPSSRTTSFNSGSGYSSSGTPISISGGSTRLISTNAFPSSTGLHAPPKQYVPPAVPFHPAAPERQHPASPKQYLALSPAKPHVVPKPNKQYSAPAKLTLPAADKQYIPPSTVTHTSETLGKYTAPSTVTLTSETLGKYTAPSTVTLTSETLGKYTAPSTVTLTSETLGKYTAPAVSAPAPLKKYSAPVVPTGSLQQYTAHHTVTQTHAPKRTYGASSIQKTIASVSKGSLSTTGGSRSSVGTDTRYAANGGYIY